MDERDPRDQTAWTPAPASPAASLLPPPPPPPSSPSSPEPYQSVEQPAPSETPSETSGDDDPPIAPPFADATPADAPRELRNRCPNCGSVMVLDTCAQCGRQGGRPAPVAIQLPIAPHAAWSPGEVAVASLVGLLTVAVIVLSVMVSSLRGDVGDARTEARRSEARMAEIEQSLTETNSAQSSLAERIGAVESTADPATVAAAVQPSVFTVEAGNSLGTAFVISTDYAGASTLVTNYHVVESQLERGDTSVHLSQENNVNYDGNVVRVDKGGDLALIIAPAVLPVLPRVDAMPRPGEPVLVIGSPLGLGGSVTSGAVSALRTINGITYLQISAPINPGNSGGPVVNEAGQVIGIAVAKVVAEEVEGIGFAIPISDLCVKLQDCPA